MNYILFDDSTRINLLPFTFTRPVADIRIGILTIREKWEKYLGCKTSTLTETYLSKKFPLVEEDENILINASILPNQKLVDEIKSLKPNQALSSGDYIIAFSSSDVGMDNTSDETASVVEEIETNALFTKLNNVWEIFSFNDEEIRNDFNLITKGRKSIAISDTNNCSGAENIFIEEGAKVEFSIINAKTGPVYIGKDAEIMEGCMVRGPFAMGQDSVLKMGTKVYGATTLGPYSKAGGELNNVVFFGYSNKAHDGFIGNSVIGEWCNLGADTNASNLKNSYDEVKLWSYTDETFIGTGLQFCGLIMGDHSKCGINTMFNTGTVVGVSSNVFGSGFQRNFIPSFTWGGVSGFTTYDIKKAIRVAKRVFERREIEFDEIEQNILTSVFKLTYKNRLL
ncbi:MAG: GlmU family protein [Bacteroidota bacterium]